jgi:uncharacterized protein (DUF433 family)
VVGVLAQGWPEEEVLRNSPGITRKDVQACVQYARSVPEAERVYPVPQR